jgi:hypothetical protein
VSYEPMAANKLVAGENDSPVDFSRCEHVTLANVE